MLRIFFRAPCGTYLARRHGALMRHLQDEARMKTQTLLQELDGMCHGARLKRVAGLGRTLDAAARGALLAGLRAEQEMYPRMVAVVLADAAKDLEALWAASQDASRMIKRMAGAALIRREQDAARLAAWYLGEDEACRRLARGHILRRGRRDVAALLVEPLLERGDVHDATALIALCGVALMESVVASLEPQQVRWKHISAAHLPLAMRQLTRSLEQSSDAARSWVWATHGPTALAMARREPGALLELLGTYTPQAHMARWLMPALGVLARRAPEAFAAWMLDDAQRAWATVLSAELPRSSQQALPRAAHVELVRRQLHAPTSLGRLLRALSPMARGEIFDAACEGVDTARSQWPDDLLEALPWQVRQREARRIMGLREVRGSTAAQARYAGFLAAEEAAAVLRPLSRGSTAEDRAVGNAGLMHNARRERQGMSAVVAELAGRIKNDQDPVRMATMQALAQCPGQRFAAADMEHVLAMVRAVVEARDTSYMTRAACAQVAHKLLKEYAADPQDARFMAALTILRELAGQGGTLDFPYNLKQGLRRGAEDALVAALLPWLKAGSARNYHVDALSLAARLGERGQHIEALQEMLEEAIWATPTYASAALPLWLGDPTTREARVIQALARDPSVVVFEPVWSFLHARRQDLLDPFIKGAKLTGRFASGTGGWVFPARDGFDRWLPRQQRALAAVLRRVVADTEHQSWTRVAAIAPLAAMPIHGPQDLADLVASPEVPICEAALGALIWTDRPQEALPMLLEHVDGDRARVAMYAVPRVARFMSGPALLAQMEELLGRERVKVTVLKEALRLVGGVGGAAAARVLMEVWRRPKLHRDARIAALHAARGLLDHGVAWTMLEEATADAELYAAQALLEAQPLGMEPRHRERYTQVLLRLANHSDRQIAKAFFEAMSRPAYGVGDWLEIGRDAVTPAAAAEAVRMEDTVVWQAAMRCLCELLMRRPQHTRPVTEVMETLVGLAREELAAPMPDVERDMPATQRLARLVSHLTAQPWQRKIALKGSLPTLASALANTPALALLATALRLATAQPELPELAPQIEALLSDAAVLGALRPALEARCAEALTNTAQTGDALRHLPTLDLLIASALPSARRVALAALTTLGASQQWGAPWVERLMRLRFDADAGVAALASMVFILPEDDSEAELMAFLRG
jgi:hypothetical protein